MVAGDRMRVWWAPTGATILRVSQYTGKYPKHFDVWLDIDATGRTKSGVITMAYNSSDFARDKL